MKHDIVKPGPHYQDELVTLWHGDCLDILRTLPDASVHAVVTDPPYALEFMGRQWDSWDSPADFEAWCAEWAAECLRVLKPGGHLLAFGGSRTWHRLAAGIEDAGFDLRDSIAWLYGSGFPKSLDVAKAIDSARDDRAALLEVAAWLAAQRDAAGMTNRDIDEALGYAGMAGHWTARADMKIVQVPRWDQWERLRGLIGFSDEMDAEVWRLNGRKGTPGNERSDRQVGAPGANAVFQPTQRVLNAGTPVLDEAKRWEGWGTALKPSFEPIVVARKPLGGTVAANVLAHGTGALNIDASRIHTAGSESKAYTVKRLKPGATLNSTGGNWRPEDEDAPEYAGETKAGRWPTNVVLDESQADALDEQTGELSSGMMRSGQRVQSSGGEIYGKRDSFVTSGATYGDSGGASRFFPTFRYEAKAPSSERPKHGEVQHPTVKPLDLMRWLVRLVTPPDGVVLEPFAGSGTTVEAALLEGFRCIAIEREADYLPLIEQRIRKPLQQSLFGDWDGAA